MERRLDQLANQLERLLPNQHEQWRRLERRPQEQQLEQQRLEHEQLRPAQKQWHRQRRQRCGPECRLLTEQPSWKQETPNATPKATPNNMVKMVDVGTTSVKVSLSPDEESTPLEQVDIIAPSSPSRADQDNECRGETHALGIDSGGDWGSSKGAIVHGLARASWRPMCSFRRQSFAAPPTNNMKNKQYDIQQSQSCHGLTD